MAVLQNVVITGFINLFSDFVKLLIKTKFFTTFVQCVKRTQRNETIP